jgi:hypothetical protein
VEAIRVEWLASVAGIQHAVARAAIEETLEPEQVVGQSLESARS